MRRSEEINEIAAAFAKFQGEMKPVSKDTKGYNFKYASFEDMEAAAFPLLSKYGLSLTQGPLETENPELVYSCTLIVHNSGQWYESRLPIYLPRDKYPDHNKYMQAQGAMIGYAERRGFKSICGIITGEPDIDSLDIPTKSEQLPSTNERIVVTPKSSTPKKINSAQYEEIIRQLDSRNDLYKHVKAQLEQFDIITLKDLNDFKNLPESSYIKTLELIAKYKEAYPRPK